MNERKKLYVTAFSLLSIMYTLLTSSYLGKVWNIEPLTLLSVVTSLYCGFMLILMIAFTLKTAVDWRLPTSVGLAMAFAVILSIAAGLYIDLLAHTELLHEGITRVAATTFFIIHIFTFIIILKVTHSLKIEGQI